MAVSEFASKVWGVSGLTLANTPETQLPASSLKIGTQAIDTDNVRLFEVVFDVGLSAHAWILIGPVALAGSGTATLDFGSGKETQTTSVAVGGQVAILSTSTVMLALGPGPTAEHSVDEHAMASTVMGLTARNVTAGVGFTIEGTIQDGARGRFIVSWSWRNG
mgnify:CR=1 FL=1|jgi:hypothetical protein